MSIFDYFVSKTMNDPEKKPPPATPYKKLSSALEESGAEVKAQYPDDGETVDGFVRKLKEACKARRQKTPDGEAQPVKAEAHFCLSKDRMSAYACVLPPENEGDGITLNEFLADMHYEGIQHGVLQEEIQQELERGYLRVFPAARGSLPQAGEDGKVKELFRRNGNMRLEVQNEGQIDFRRDIPLQPVRKGTVICLIRPPKPGTDGMTVTGQSLPCPQAASAQVPQGKNTVIGRGGQALMADVDGILYIEEDRFCVHEQKVMEGDVNQFQGTLQVSGNLYIDGNVDGGVDIEASGDIMISGRLGQARVHSVNGTIRVQQGIYGTEGKTVISADHQVQSPVMEWADITAGTGVIAEMISNCAICCDGTVYAVTGRGMIVGSQIQAGDSILCQRVGNLAGERSRFSVGYPPHSAESWVQLKAELTQVQATIKKLWATIADLRKKGSRISDMEKSVLDRLVEQRNLYTEKREELTAELGLLDQMMDKKSKGKIQCETLHPQLEVRIGRLSEEITTTEENCSIHVEDGKIYLR